MVPSGINVPPGQFGKNNNRTPLNKRTVTRWKTQGSITYEQPLLTLLPK